MDGKSNITEKIEELWKLHAESTEQLQRELATLRREYNEGWKALAKHLGHVSNPEDPYCDAVTVFGFANELARQRDTERGRVENLQRELAEARAERDQLARDWLERPVAIENRQLEFESDGLRKELKAERERAERAEEDLDWISRASRGEVEDMLMNSTCDDVVDMRRFIATARKEKS